MPTASVGSERTAEAAAFPRLTEDQIERFANVGEEVTAADGELLIRAGDRNYPLLIVREGTVRIIEERKGSDDLVLHRHPPREFVGDIDLISGRPAIFCAIAEGDCRLIRVSRDDIRGVARSDVRLGEMILRAIMVRRDILGDTGFVGARLVGSRWDRKTAEIKELLDRNGVPYTWLDPERDPKTDDLLESLNVQPGDLPIVVPPGDTDVLREPTPKEVAAAFGLTTTRSEEQVWDVAIVGAGPAGLAAAVYAGSEGLSTLVLDAQAPGGQAGTSSKIENYPGFPTGISGADLAQRTAVQAQKFGARFRVSCAATGLERRDGRTLLQLDCDETVEARTVVVAAGATYRRLNLEHEDDFAGTGIYYGATQMEATMCANEPVAVVGGGNSAGQAAVFLSGQAKRVLMLVRGDSLANSMSRYLIERLEATENIELLYHTKITKLEGDTSAGRLQSAWLKTGEDDDREVPLAGLFVMIGAEPRTDWLRDTIALDDHGFILTGPDVPQERWPLTDRGPRYLETSLPGVFAAGDVRSDSTKRVATAVGDGAMAIRFVHSALAE
ncbi:MAG: FAD-dependent oxidoreductase [Planctomycetota bacterium]